MTLASTCFQEKSSRLVTPLYATLKLVARITPNVGFPDSNEASRSLGGAYSSPPRDLGSAHSLDGLG